MTFGAKETASDFPSRRYEIEAAAPIAMAYPRMLIIDPTRIGSMSATGQVKARLFRGWPRDSYLQVFRSGDAFGLCDSSGSGRSPVTADQALDVVRGFDPELIYVRPLADPAHVFEFSCRILERYPDVPLTVHIMDDWMDRLRLEAPESYALIEPSIRTMIERASLRLSISDEMSTALWQRYGRRFEPYANIVEPSEVLALGRVSHASRPTFILRYSGAFATDMSATSLTDVADAVEEAAKIVPMRLEVSILPPWRKQAESVLNQYRYVGIDQAERDETEYQRWLAGADANLLAYNFDERSLAYIKYSLANKLPDCLAAGRPVIAYGPPALPTIRLARESGAAISVNRRDHSAIVDALTQLALDPELQSELSERARLFALRRLNGPVVRTDLHRRLAGLTGRGTRNISYLSFRGQSARPTSPHKERFRMDRNRPVNKKPTASVIRRVYGDPARDQSVRSTLRMIAAAFGGKLGLPLVGAAVALVGAALAVILDASGRVGNLLAITGGLLLVLAIAAATARLRKERRRFGFLLETSTRHVVASLADTVEASRTAVSELNRRITSELGSERELRLRYEQDLTRRLESHRRDVTTSLAALESRLADLSGKIGSVDALAATNTKLIEELGTGSLAELRTSVGAVQERLNRLSADLSLDRMPSANARSYQPFSRLLTGATGRDLVEEWGSRLGVRLTEREVAYMAHHIGVTEEICLGRLATPTDRMITRLMTARAASEQARHRGTRLRILEIGTLFGIGLGLLFEHCRDRGVDIELTAIDPLDGYYGHERPDIITGVPVSKPVLVENLHRMRVPDESWRLVQELSETALRRLSSEEAQFDMIVIDGDHSYEGVKLDLEGSIQCAAPGGYIVLDDYQSPDWPDIAKYVDEEVRFRPDLQFVVSGYGSAVFRMVHR